MREWIKISLMTAVIKRGRDNNVDMTKLQQGAILKA